MTKKVFAKVLNIFTAIILLAPMSASALSQSQTSVLNSGTYYYDTDVPSEGSACGDSTTSSGLVWPFAAKSTDQYQRVDQGWDIQSTAGAAVYAIAAGTIHVYAPNPGGFGNDYPTEQLDASIGGPSDWVYYGHVHVLPQVIDKHVNAGQQIAVANTTDPQNGSAAPPGWLEIGFARPGTDAPIDDMTTYEAATVAGQDMKNILLNANPPSGAGSTSSSESCCSVSISADVSSAPASQCDSLSPPDPGTVSGNVALGKQMAADAGWTGSEWACLYTLWQHESGWSETADNPTSDAYGIPQALPGDKMASAGGDWRTSAGTQIKWGIGYISGRYRTPCAAWQFWLSNSPHWY